MFGFGGGQLTATSSYLRRHVLGRGTHGQHHSAGLPALLQRPRARVTGEHSVSHGEMCHGELCRGELCLEELYPINDTRTHQLPALLGSGGEGGSKGAPGAVCYGGAMRMWAPSRGARCCVQPWGCLFLRSTGGAHSSPAPQCTKEQLNSINPGTILATLVNFCTQWARGSPRDSLPPHQQCWLSHFCMLALARTCCVHTELCSMHQIPSELQHKSCTMRTPPPPSPAVITTPLQPTGQFCSPWEPRKSQVAEGILGHGAAHILPACSQRLQGAPTPPSCSSAMAEGVRELGIRHVELPGHGDVPCCPNTARFALDAPVPPQPSLSL